MLLKNTEITTELNEYYKKFSKILFSSKKIRTQIQHDKTCPVKTAFDTPCYRRILKELYELVFKEQSELPNRGFCSTEPVRRVKHYQALSCTHAIHAQNYSDIVGKTVF